MLFILYSLSGLLTSFLYNGVCFTLTDVFGIKTGCLGSKNDSLLGKCINTTMLYKFDRHLKTVFEAKSSSQQSID